MSKSYYFDYKKVLSYQAIFNFIIGDRGLGKTYGFLKYFTNRFIKYGEEFIYLRRFGSEIDEIKDKLFNYHIKNNEFGDHKIKYQSEVYYLDDKPFCYMKPLTKEGHIKSVPMPKVKYVMYDEFLLTNPNQHYIKNEPTQLLSFLESVFRERDPKLFCLGNASTITNPYFEYFHLKLPYKSEYQLFNDGLILVNYPQNKEFREHKTESKFGQIIKNTPYGQYSINSKFIQDNHDFIAKRTPKSWMFACLYLNQHNYGLWIDSDTGLMYVSKAYDPLNPRRFSILSDDHTEISPLATIRSNPWFKKMIDNYRCNALFFENINIKNYVLRALRKYL